MRPFDGLTGRLINLDIYIYIYINTHTHKLVNKQVTKIIIFCCPCAQDQIIRFGGDTDPSLPWPENHSANDENSMEKHLGP